MSYKLNMNCDFKKISAKEFEKLSASILSIYLGEEFRTFKEGPDSGADIDSLRVNEHIIGQCKRYSTSYSKLYNSLKQEVKKLKKLKPIPKDYYLFTTIDLTRKQLYEIVDLFKGFMHSTRNIFDKTRIEKILDRDEYQDARKTNLSLFVNSIKLLEDFLLPDTFIDSYSLIKRIEEHKDYYVYTNYFDTSLSLWNKKKVLVLTGDPGVGKSTLSEMLILQKMKDFKRNAKLIYVSSGNLQVLKDNLKVATGPTIIYLDDFLGSNILNVSDDYSKQLSPIIDLVHFKKDFYLLLNSRSTIYNNAFNREAFKNNLRGLSESLISINEPNRMDKAEILKRHIIVSKMPSNFIKYLVKDRRCLSVVDHPNYNPRIIERITREDMYMVKTPNEYFDKCKNYLNNPSAIWKDEFNSLSEESRYLVQTVYSSSNVNEEPIIEKSFYLLLGKKKPDFDSSTNIYKKSLESINNSFVKITLTPKDKLISIANHSIDDFLLEDFKNRDQSELDILYTHYIYFDQLIKIDRAFLHKKYFEEAIKSGLFEKWLYRKFDKGSVILCYLSEYKVKDLKYLPYLLDGFKKASYCYYSEIGDSNYLKYFKSFLTPENISYYNLDSIDEESFESLIDIVVKYSYLEDMVRIADSLGLKDNEYFLNSLASKLVEELTYSALLTNYISDSYSSGMDEYELERETKKLFKYKMKNGNTGEYFIDYYVKSFDSLSIYFDDVIEDEDIMSDIKDFLKEENETFNTTVDSNKNEYSDEEIMEIFSYL